MLFPCAQSKITWQRSLVSDDFTAVKLQTYNKHNVHGVRDVSFDFVYNCLLMSYGFNVF